VSPEACDNLAVLRQSNVLEGKAPFDNGWGFLAQIPDTEQSRVASGYQVFPVRQEKELLKVRVVTRETVLQAIGFGIPHTDRSCASPRCELTAVGSVRGRVHDTLATLQRLQAFPAASIPDANDLVITYGHKAVLVRRESDCMNPGS